MMNNAISCNSIQKPPENHRTAFGRYFFSFSLNASGIHGLALTYGLEEQDSGTDRHIERVEPAQHGNADMGIGSTTPGVGQSC